jgi:hypothetical protein
MKPEQEYDIHEAIQLMKARKKVKHIYFEDGEYLTSKNNCETIINESGHEITLAEFRSIYTSPVFDYGWIRYYHNFYFAVTGVYHGSLIEADDEEEAKEIFTKAWEGEKVIHVKKRPGLVYNS